MCISKIKAVFLIAALCVLMGCDSPSPSTKAGAAQDAAIASGAAEVTIPAGTFSKEVTATLKENAVDVSGIKHAKPIGNAVTLEFSETVLSQTDSGMTLTVSIPEAQISEARTSKEVVYMMMKVEGGVQDSSGWFIQLGSLDDSGKLTIPLYATAKAIHAVPVRGKNLVVYFDPKKSASRKSKISSKTVTRVTNWTEYPWAIICNKPEFEGDGVSYCDFGTRGYILDALSQRLSRHTDSIASLGFPKARVQQTTFQELQRRGLPAALDPNFNAQVISGQVDPNAGFNLAYFTKSTLTGCIVDARGCYQYETGALEITDAALDEGDHSTVAHELFHAVQAAEAPNLNRFGKGGSWIAEGTASSVGMWIVGGKNAGHLFDAHFDGVFRNWNSTLRDSGQLMEYYTSEFFNMIQDGSLEYLPALLDGLQGADPSNSYASIDGVLQGAVGAGLIDSYALRVVANRGVESGNPHCLTVDASPDRTTVVPKNITPMSSYCYRFKMKNNGYNVFSTSLPNGNNHPTQMLIVTGNSVEGGTAFSENGANGAYVRGDQLLTVYGRTIDAIILDTDMARADSDTDPIVLQISPRGPMTGTWCALEDQLTMTGLCMLPASVLRITQDGKTLTGTVDTGDCVNEKKAITAGEVVGDLVTITTVAESDGCSISVHDYELIFQPDGSIKGTVKAGRRTATIHFQHSSSNPDTLTPYPIPELPDGW